MVAEQVDRFILGLVERTREGALKWKEAGKIVEWEELKKSIIKSDDFKDYFIDDSKSYVIQKNDGYVFLINTRYGNAPVFSRAFDKYVLFVKINEDLSPQNLSDYLGEKDFQEKMRKLVNEIETKKCEKYEMPQVLYDFMNDILEG